MPGYATRFKEDLRAVYMKTGVKSIPTVFLFTDQHIFKESALIFLNDILSLGYPPGLFAEEDKDTICNGVRNAAKQAGVMDQREARRGRDSNRSCRGFERLRSTDHGSKA